MSDSNNELAPTADYKLRALAISERLEFYREASRTTHSDIKEHILKEMELDAKHRRAQEALASAHTRKQEARLSPNIALAVCIMAFLLAAGTDIYSHIALKVPLLGELTGLCMFAALIISATALLLSNALKPAEFLQMLHEAKTYIGFGKPDVQTSGEADTKEQAPE